MKKQQKLLWIALLLMVAINLTWLIYQVSPNSVRTRHPRKGIDFITKELSLTPEQTKKFEMLREKHFLKIRETHHQLKNAKDNYFSSAFEDNEEQSAENLQHLQALNQKLEVQTFQHFKEIKALLTEEQVPKFKNILHEILGPPKHVKHHGPPHHPPPPHLDR